jgi:hypothetical protein
MRTLGERILLKKAHNYIRTKKDEKVDGLGAENQSMSAKKASIKGKLPTTSLFVRTTHRVALFSCRLNLNHSSL